MRAPEKWHRVERLVPTDHVARRGLALSFGDNPVLNANLLPCVRIGPTCDVACRKNPRNAGPQIPVDGDAAVQRNPRLFRKSDRRPYADTHDDQVCIERLIRFKNNLMVRERPYFAGQVELNAMFLVEPPDHRADLASQNPLHRYPVGRDHIHMHMVPRWVGDTNFMTTIASVRVLPEALSESFAKLRASWPE